MIEDIGGVNLKKYKLIWDEYNISHIAKHGLKVKEVEEAVNDKKRLVRKFRKRYMILGSAWGRIIVVILEKVRDGYYVVTARDVTTSEKRLYKRR